jgi:hypothetical protein
MATIGAKEVAEARKREARSLIGSGKNLPFPTALLLPGAAIGGNGVRA